jgi:hypothetical protein
MVGAAGSRGWIGGFFWGLGRVGSAEWRRPVKTTGQDARATTLAALAETPRHLQGRFFFFTISCHGVSCGWFFDNLGM